jgi:small subunit ribosomal protein S19
LKKEKEMSRSLSKGPFVHPSLFKKNLNLKQPFKIWCRNSFIIPEFVDSVFNIHNGKSFVQIKVIEDMVGHKFGEFASTRKKNVFKKKLKKK